MKQDEIQFRRLADLARERGGRDLHLRRSDILFRQGESGDQFYYVRRGRLRVYRTHVDGQRKYVGEVGRGEIVGEMAVLGDYTRSATVIAERDCEVIEISSRLLETLPSETLLAVMRLLVGRMRRMIEGGGMLQPPLPHCIAVLPHTPNVPAEAYCRQLTEALEKVGRPASLVVERELPSEFRGLEKQSDSDFKRLGKWLDDLEENSNLLILLADATDTAWTELCLLQADIVLLVAASDDDPTPNQAERSIARLPGANKGARPQVDLVLIQKSEPYKGTSRWLEVRDVVRHFHYRPNSSIDRDRAARFISGRKISFALGGGGARGFAHVGLLRACQEMGVPIDSVGGTSMGAAVGALIAQGLDWKEMVERLRDHFLPKRKLSQYTFPVYSVDTGRKFNRMLESLFGETQIEDLPINYFCVTSNMTRAEPRIHRSGSLARWVATSMTLPGFVPPYIDRGELLVDGGLLNNVPVDVALSEGTGMVVGVDVSPEGEVRLPQSYSGRPSLWDAFSTRFLGRRAPDGSVLRFPGIASTLWRSATLGSIAKRDADEKLADLYIRMPVASIPILAFDELDSMVKVGYDTGLKALSPVAEWARNIQAEKNEDC